MDTSGGFFFSFDAPASATAEEEGGATQASGATSSSTWPAPSSSTARFPWVKLDEATLSQWTGAYCSGADTALRTSTKPRQLKLEIPRCALVTPAGHPATAVANEILSFTLCYQTSPEVSTLTSVTGTEGAEKKSHESSTADSMAPLTTTTTTTEHRDVIPGRYYGGLKVWSCATLLAEYLVQHAAHYSPLLRAASVVVELGCGQALPGLAALCLGARRVVFQDYNEEVLTVCTKPNLGATLAANRAALSSSSSGVAERQVKFVHGDWVDLKWEGTPVSGDALTAAPDAFCDVALGADVTFDKEACDKLACVLQRWLRPHTGEAVIASKDYYFGTNGGYLEFTRSAASHGLQVYLLQRVDTADKMPHVILRVTHKRL